MIVATAILFHPDPERLDWYIASVLKAVDFLVLVDNTPVPCVAASSLAERVSYISLERNAGVATAQNIGIRKAVEMGADYILILDQDSDISTRTVSEMLTAFMALGEQGEKVGAVGAYYVESYSQRPAEVTSVKDGQVVFTACPTSVPYVRSDTLISSGCLISTPCLRDVGLMTEVLFIDWVDLEWCLRAKKRGWSCYMVPEARMAHTIGQIRITTRKGHPAALHSTFRLYYQVRNSLVLCGQGWVDDAWRREFFRQGFSAKIPRFLYHSPSRFSALWVIFRASVAGMFMAWKYRKGLPVTRFNGI